MPNTLYCLEKVDLAAHVLKDTLRTSGYKVALDGHIQPIVSCVGTQSAKYGEGETQLVEVLEYVGMTLDFPKLMFSSTGYETLWDKEYILKQ
ncbi:hypothetical protein Anapl_14513 [Anas platyrhynchos]|uniref:Uncharacterized protein n=1 Tax=Anas platyrhynchos TaxID=8839 RepID=R0JZB1_ANAPL|nr:hypothetical protein Anapl_14513 [Anas platyrhynchos]